MKNEPDFARQLKDAEKLGQFEGKIVGSYEQLESSESLSEDVSDETSDFGEDDRKRKEGGAGDNQGNKLQQDLTKLRLIISSMDDLVFVLDKNGIFTDYFQPNKIAELYVPPEKFIDKSFREILPPPVVKLFDDAINTMLINNSPQQFDYCLELRNSVRWFNAKISMWRDNSDRFLGTVAVVRDVTERKQIEEAFRKSEERYRTSIELTQLLVWTTTSNGEVVKDISIWRKFTGQSYEEVKGTGWMKALHPDDLDYAIQAWKKAVETKAAYETEYRIRRFDGVYRNFLARGIPILKEDGDIWEWTGICIDITERKRAEEGLKANEQKYRVLIENLPQKIFVKDKNSTYISCNENYARDLKIKPDEITGRTDFEFYPKELAEKYRADDKRIMESGEIEDLEEKYMQNGQERFVHTVKTPLKDEKGIIFGLLGIFYDITGRKQAEEKAEESTRRLRTVIETVAEGITFSDAKGHFEIFNSKMREITGYMMEEANSCGDFTSLLYADPQERKKALDGLNELIMTGKPTNIETAIQTKDGTNKTLLVSTSIVPYKNHDMFLSVYRDITERKRTQEKLREKEERYHALYEGSRDGYLMTDMNDNIIEYNTAFKKMLDYSDDELHKKTCKDITPQEWHSIETTIVKEQVLERGYSDFYEKEFIRKDGRIIPVELRQNLIKENGRPVGIWGFVRDITDRKQIEYELNKKINALERYKNITVGRELKMIELKKQIKELEEKLINTR